MWQLKPNSPSSNTDGTRIMLGLMGNSQHSLCTLATSLLVLQALHMPTLRAQQFQQRIVPIPHPLTSLLRAQCLYEELGLQADQIDAITQAVDTTDLPLWTLRDQCCQKRNATASRLIGQLKARTSEILSKSQLERLNQILWQALGIDAVLEPEVVDRLKLSREQERNIGAFLDVADKKLGALQRNTAIRSESARGAHLQKLHAETQQNINAVLGPSQQKALETLTGRRFGFSRIRNIACKAPRLDVNTWINSSPVKPMELRGGATVVHFYASGCGNCVRTLPYLNDWHKRFAAEGLRIIGIHRPETEQERDVDRVRYKAAEAEMAYPIGVDNDSLTWNAWANRVWPSIYLIDKDGYIRYWWYGELNWQGAESEVFLRSKIRELIAESRSPGLVSAGS